MAVIVGIGVYWLIAYLTSPPIGRVSTWPDRDGGFIRFMADEKRVGYLMVSRLPEDAVSVSGQGSWGFGVNSFSVTIRTLNGESQEVDLGRKPTVIMIGNDGSIDIQYLPITRDDLSRLEQSLEASAQEEGACQAASVVVASNLITRLEH